MSRSVGNKEVFETMAAAHPAGPHWHLPLIGVDPDQWGIGLGWALLRHALGRCDHEGERAYLETASPITIPPSGRNGSEVVDALRVGGCSPLYPMTRRPLAGVFA